jgi:hypothetical protein
VGTLDPDGFEFAGQGNLLTESRQNTNVRPYRLSPVDSGPRSATTFTIQARAVRLNAGCVHDVLA